MQKNITKLAKIYPWPDRKPDVMPDPHGWLNQPTKQMLAKHLDGNMKVVVELGSWLGLSSKYILSHAPDAILICVDHWQGSKQARNAKNSVMQHRLLTLYETFQVNLWKVRHRVIPIRSDSWRGLEIIHEYGVIPDLVYIDASHEYIDVFKDVDTAVCLFPDSIICGDDWGLPGVRQAITEIARSRNLDVVTYGGWAWEYGKKRTCP